LPDDKNERRFRFLRALQLGLERLLAERFLDDNPAPPQDVHEAHAYFLRFVSHDDEKTQLKDLDKKLKALIFGQNEAIDRVVASLKMSRTGLFHKTNGVSN
jgi:ATP-dependent Clp protease ATP-binding subunit ClpA